MIVIPAWSKCNRTPDELTREIGNGFEFKGPGFYFQPTEFSLIVPNGASVGKYGGPFNSSPGEGQRFDFHHYECPFEASFFAYGTAPTRQDTRD